MKRKVFTALAFLCFVIISTAAIIADLSGKWVGSLKAPDGNEYPLTYTLKLDGDKLTGAGSSPGGDVAIANARVKGDSIFFTIPINGADIKHAGKFYAAADSIGMDIIFNDIKMHTTLKRSADK